MTIKLSGEYGEGGGSICRVALALSSLTGKSFEVDNIRKGRCKSGLKAQHLHGIKGAQQLCDAKVEGAELGSEYLKFEPSELKSKDLPIDIGTAGSITLTLQSLLLPSIFGDKNIKIKLIGGSDCQWSPPYDYLKEILIPQIQKFCKSIDTKLIKRGYYPKGGGIVEIKINPKYKLSDFNSFDEFLGHLKNENLDYNLLEQENLIQIKGVSHASSNLQKASVAERQAKAAKILLGRYNCPIDVRTEYCNTLSPGSGIALWAIFSKRKDDIDEKNPIRLGADALGELGKKAEIVGREAAQNLTREIESKAPVDKHLADQILPFMALTKNSKIKVSEITSHCKTNMYVIQQFLGNVFAVNEEGKLITVK